MGSVITLTVDCSCSSLLFLCIILVCILNVMCECSVVVMVARGCGGLELTTPVPFSAERTSDFNAAVTLVHTRYPKSQLFAMGFSLGASLTVKYMADYADTTPVTGALAVSPPWDFSCPHSYTFQFFWTFLLVNILKGWALPHMWTLGRKNLKLFLAPTMYRFDNMIAPLHGFKDVHEYYTASSVVRVMHKIQKPTLVLSSIDDSVCNIDGCPTEASK
jgi:predicted alpha/beta-fold hydrolase